MTEQLDSRIVQALVPEGYTADVTYGKSSKIGWIGSRKGWNYKIQIGQLSDKELIYLKRWMAQSTIECSQNKRDAIRLQHRQVKPVQLDLSLLSSLTPIDHRWVEVSIGEFAFLSPKGQVIGRTTPCLSIKQVNRLAAQLRKAGAQYMKQVVEPNAIKALQNLWNAKHGPPPGPPN